MLKVKVDWLNTAFCCRRLTQYVDTKKKYLHVRGTYDFQFGPLIPSPVISLQHIHVFVDSPLLIMAIIFVVIIQCPKHSLLLVLLGILLQEDFGPVFVLIPWNVLMVVASMQLIWKTRNITRDAVGNTFLFLVYQLKGIFTQWTVAADNAMKVKFHTYRTSFIIEWGIVKQHVL